MGQKWAECLIEKVDQDFGFCVHHRSSGLPPKHLEIHLESPFA